MGMRNFPDETGLADAWLANQRDDLAVAGVGARQSLADGFDLGVAADEAREPARRRRLQARAREPGAYHEHLDRLAEPLHGDRAERLDLDVALGEAEGGRGKEDGTRCR